MVPRVKDNDPVGTQKTVSLTGAKPVLGPSCMIPNRKGSKSELDKTLPIRFKRLKKSKSMNNVYNLQDS